MKPAHKICTGFILCQNHTNLIKGVMDQAKKLPINKDLLKPEIINYGQK